MSGGSIGLFFWDGGGEWEDKGGKLQENGYFFGFLL